MFSLFLKDLISDFYFRDFGRDYDNLNVAINPKVSYKMSKLIKHKLQLMSETRKRKHGVLFA